ncbi:dnaJ domain-containing protein [Sarocladium implicatum]|nr:dnaJ domain-containing protein [Sarocladium implicatum]
MGERDYYADLELPPTADIPEIKKQFRKLALKYHPDRNPGRETEVNAKFQEIQSAHEILGDPQSKAKFDATFSRRPHVGASGVKGNPWSHVGEQFPAPPRRNNGPGTRRTAPPPPQPTGAQRWQTRFASGTAPTAKQQSANDPQLKKNAAQAFEHMRKKPGPSGASPSRPPRPASGQPPPMPPRNESARQRREASFGTRRAGYQPGDRSGEDEPPVTRHSYHSSAKAPPPRPPKEPMTPQKDTSVPMADPLAQFREPASPLDPRPRMPYSNIGGEKTNPSEGQSPARAKSARETTHRTDQSSSDDLSSSRHAAHRSSSVPRAAATDRLGDDLGAGGAYTGPIDGHDRSSFKSRQSGQYPEHATGSGSKSADERSSRPHKSTDAYAANDGQGKRPSMYGTSFQRHNTTAACGDFHMYQTPDSVTTPLLHRRNTTGDRVNEGPKAVDSSELHPSPSISPYDRQQYQVLDQLISNASRRDIQSHDTNKNPIPNKTNDLTRVTSFNIPDGESHAQDSPDPKPFSRRSTEEIDTSFVEEDAAASWKFSAGGERPMAQPKRRTKPEAPGSPTKNPHPPTATDTSHVPNARPDGPFNPGGWGDQFGPETFVPQRDQTASASPTRTNRKNSRKTKTGAKLAAGVAGATAATAVLIDDSSDDDGPQWQGRKPKVEGGIDSPQAMDLDSPPAKPADAPPPQHPARNITVEPTRPEWREGHVDETNGEEKTGSASGLEPGLSAGGSEDTEEFRASFSDLRNVAPFANKATGLKSFDDLKDNLPFESRASSDTPIALPPVQPLNFPGPPTAPRPPPTAAIAGMRPNVSSWTRYLQDFEQYLRAWEIWNSGVLDHFRERKRQIKHARDADDYAFLGLIGDSGVMDYYSWLQQDNDVRRRWNAACEEHEQRFREFIAFRGKMK